MDKQAIMDKEMNKSKIEKWNSQLRKGILDLIILLYLSKKEYYGYELISKIKDSLDLSLSEGTIYPLLNRLNHEKLIVSKWIEMERGIPRKYYSISEKGLETLKLMMEEWLKFSDQIAKLVRRAEK
jgi:PadR family transcriptional regulator PadR